MSRQTDDYAILIGIDKYKDAMFPDLSSPSKDMMRFKRWLMDKNGGNLPETNIYLIPDGQKPFVEGTPCTKDFHVEFVSLIENHVPGRRLYLFFSGHGYTVKLEDSQRTALYAADASYYGNYHISGSDYASWIKNAGKFDEILLIMDCCRDAEIMNHISYPPLPIEVNEAKAAEAKLMCIYGAPKGGKAQEREIPELNNQVSSLLTHAVLKALEYAPTNKEGEIVGYAIKNFIEDSWDNICGDNPADAPAIQLPDKGDIVFRTSAPKPLSSTFEIRDWVADCEIVIKNLNSEPVCRVHLQQPEQPIKIYWHNEEVTEVPVNNKHFSIPLTSGLYSANINWPGKTLVLPFQSGGDNVQF